MELHDPVAIYTAASDLEAYEIVELLQGSEIPAQVIEDMNLLDGLNPPVHAAKVWVASGDLERATAVTREYEARVLQRDLAHHVPVDLNSEWIDARCDKCGTVTRYAPIQKGAVENCPNCYAFMDIGSDVDFDDWNVIDAETNGENDGEGAEPEAEAEAAQ